MAPGFKLECEISVEMVFPTPKTPQNKHFAPENGGPLEVWRFRTWKASFPGSMLILGDVSSQKYLSIHQKAHDTKKPNRWAARTPTQTQNVHQMPHVSGLPPPRQDVPKNYCTVVSGQQPGHVYIYITLHMNKIQPTLFVVNFVGWKI